VINDFVGHFVAFLGLGSAFQFVYWLMEYSEKTNPEQGMETVFL